MAYFQVLPQPPSFRVRGNDGGLSFIHGLITANWYEDSEWFVFSSVVVVLMGLSFYMAGYKRGQDVTLNELGATDSIIDGKRPKG